MNVDKDTAQGCVDANAVDAAFEELFPGLHPNAYDHMDKRIRVAAALRAAAPHILANLIVGP